MDVSKIIRGIVNSRGYTITSAITQWDYGYVFVPEFEDMPATYRLDFSNDEHHGTALPVYCGAEGGEVPEELIDTGKDIWVWFFYIGDGFGKSEYKWRIPNKCKPKTEEDEPTPSQQSSIDQLIVRSNDAVETAEQKAEEADTSARSAKEDADRAERARDDAETAQGKAEDAQESAERAKDDAETSERNASESERKAKGYADTASEKADAITELTATAQTLPEGSSATASYNAETGVLNLGIPKGKDGTDGDDGYSPTANVSKSGKVATITITDKNGMTSAQVSDGEDGATGATPNLTIGTVETLEPTESATASITGTPENPVLNLGIPQGEQGEVTLEDYYKAFPTDTASGAVASFSDGADGLPLKSLVVNIDPIQDLHGYDSPWVGGGGKNKFDKSAVTISDLSPVYNVNDGSVYDGTKSGFDYHLPNGTYTIKFTACDTGCTYANAHVLNSDNSLVDSAFRLTTSTSATTLAKTFTISDGQFLRVYRGTTNTLDISGVNIQIEEGSTATSYAPYENICPISGWTQVDVEQSGVDVWDEQWEKNALAYGEPAANASRIRSKNYILCKPNTTYYFNKGANNGNMWAFFYDRNKVCLNPTVNGDNVSNRTFTTPDNCHYMKFFLSAQTEYQYDVAINYPSTDHDYHPYVGQTIPINWQTEAGTVYGVKLDVLRGVLTVDRAMLDLGTLTWGVNSTGVRFYATSNSVTLPYKMSQETRMICSAYKFDGYGTGARGYYGENGTFRYAYTSANAREIYIHDDSKQGMTGDEFKTAMNEVQLVYELAEPIEIQLTPHEVNSLLGVNNIFADTGDTACEYRADTKLYIERLTAPDSADMIADANIVSGQYFMVGNTLYKATANIANGGQIIVGTNCTRVSLAQALNEINA